MKNVKIYSYPYIYIKHLMESRNMELPVEVNFDVSVKIERNGSDNITISTSDGLVIAEFYDNGETMRYMKGLGKLSVAAYVASRIFDSSSFFIKDKSGYKYGVSRVSSLGCTYILLGGFCGPTSIVDISNMKKESILRVVLNKMVNDLSYGVMDFKSMKIFLNKESAFSVDSSIFVKPYVFFE